LISIDYSGEYCKNKTLLVLNAMLFGLMQLLNPSIQSLM